MRWGIAEKMAKKIDFYCHIVCRLRVPWAGSAGFCCCLKQLFCPLCHRSNCSAVGKMPLWHHLPPLLFLHQHLIGSKARRNKEMAATTQALLLCLEPKIGSWDTVMTWQGRVSWVAHTQRQPEEGVEWMGSPRWLGRFRLAWFFESCSSGNSYRACFLFGMPRNDKCQRARLSNQQHWFKELLSKAHPLWPALIITRFLLKQQNNLVSSQHF